MAGGNHSRIRVRAATIDDREDSAKRILANLEIVLIDESELPRTQRGKVVLGGLTASLA